MNTQNKIKALLAEYIGVESEDINDTDELLDDLHMSPTDVTDFFMSLEHEGYDVSKLNIPELKSVEDIVEKLSSEEEGV